MSSPGYARNRAWRARYPERWNAQKSAYRARTGSATGRDRWPVVTSSGHPSDTGDRDVCPKCGKSLAKLSTFWLQGIAFRSIRKHKDRDGSMICPGSGMAAPRG